MAKEIDAILDNFTLEYKERKKKGKKAITFTLLRNDEKDQTVTLPIIDSNEETVPELDDHFFIPAKDMFALAVGMKNKDPVMIHGPTQCGKTTTIHQLAGALEGGIVEIDCTGQTTTEDLLGTWMIAPAKGGNVMVWNDGPALEAFRNGYILVLNEFDMLRPEIAAVLNDSLLSKLRRFSTSSTNSKGKIETERVKEHGNFRLIATCNSRGYGDDDGTYEGIEYMNAATLERFPIKISMTYADPDTEIEIIKDIVEDDLDDEIIKRIVDFGTKVRVLYTTGEIKTIVSTFRLIKWSTYINDLGPDLAFQMCILNHAGKQDGDALRGIYNRMFVGKEDDIARQEIAAIKTAFGCFGQYNSTEPLCQKCKHRDRCSQYTTDLNDSDD